METKKALEVLERKNYVRITEKVSEAVIEVAELIETKMHELDIREIEVGGITLIAKEGSTTAGSYHYLAIRPYYDDDDYDYCLSWSSKLYWDYIHGDFNARVYYASNEMKVQFALNLDKILLFLEQEEERKVKRCEEALEKLKLEEKPTCEHCGINEADKEFDSFLYNYDKAMLCQDCIDEIENEAASMIDDDIASGADPMKYGYYKD